MIASLQVLQDRLSVKLSVAQLEVLRYLVTQEQRNQPRLGAQHIESITPSKTHRRPTLRALEEHGLVESFDGTEKKRFTRSNGRSVVPTGHVRTIRATRWRLTSAARKLLTTAPISELTMEDAQEHMAFVRDQDILAHEIAIACAKAFGVPAPIAVLAKRYKHQAEKIAAFQARFNAVLAKRFKGSQT